jgi:hypothetical protein
VEGFVTVRKIDVDMLRFVERDGRDICRLPFLNRGLGVWSMSNTRVDNEEVTCLV